MKNFAKVILIALALSAFGCQSGNVFQTSPTSVAPASLKDVPAVKLNFRFETDVPAPPANANQAAQSEERNAAVQNDFDQTRAQQLLDKTIQSPDKKRVLAVYHRAEDLQNEFRLDMYSPDGKLIKKITHDGMAVHFLETIVWSPDSTAVAFVAMARAAQPNNSSAALPTENANSALANEQTNSNTSAENANVENANAAQTPAATAADAPKTVLTFRTEQLYVCGADGGDLKALTQNEGLMYFYFVWSPDSSNLAALASTYNDWKFYEAQATAKGEIFIPAGRLRVVEKSGRERRLDDNLTNVRPVWSPDSAKVAGAFGTQVRIYDATGDVPTQAAIPLRNQLLISSKEYDENEQRKEQSAGNANVNSNALPITNSDQTVNTHVLPKINSKQTANANAGNANVAVNQPVGSLPDETTLVSFNPIVNLEWTEDKMLYAQTGYVKQMKNESDSARSFLRWHRLIFSPQAVALGK